MFCPWGDVAHPVLRGRHILGSLDQLGDCCAPPAGEAAAPDESPLSAAPFRSQFAMNYQALAEKSAAQLVAPACWRGSGGTVRESLSTLLPGSQYASLSLIIGPDMQLTLRLSLGDNGTDVPPSGTQAEPAARDDVSALHSTGLGRMGGTLSGWVATTGQVVAVPASRCGAWQHCGALRMRQTPSSPPFPAPCPFHPVQAADGQMSGMRN